MKKCVERVHGLIEDIRKRKKSTADLPHHKVIKAFEDRLPLKIFVVPQPCYFKTVYYYMLSISTITFFESTPSRYPPLNLLLKGLDTVKRGEKIILQN